MRLIALACEIFYREACLIAAQSPHVIELRFLPIGMHDQPNVMRAALQEKIDEIKAGQAEAILLVFGLCGNVVDGLVAREVPLIIPRAHDCITLFLGSRERYNKEFAANPGTYYYTSASFERKDPGEGAKSLGAPDPAADKDKRYAEYVAKFGEDNACYLMEVESSWTAHYTRVAYIPVPQFDFPHLREQAISRAAAHNLPLVELPADLALIQDLCHGTWPEDIFLIVPPGHTVAASHEDGVLKCVAPSTPAKPAS